MVGSACKSEISWKPGNTQNYTKLPECLKLLQIIRKPEHIRKSKFTHSPKLLDIIQKLEVARTLKFVRKSEIAQKYLKIWNYRKSPKLPENRNAQICSISCILRKPEVGRKCLQNRNYVKVHKYSKLHEIASMFKVTQNYPKTQNPKLSKNWKLSER